MAFLRKYGLWILVIASIIAVWYFYDKAQKAKVTTVIAPGVIAGVQPDYIEGDLNLDGIVDAVI